MPTITKKQKRYVMNGNITDNIQPTEKSAMPQGGSVSF